MFRLFLEIIFFLKSNIFVLSILYNHTIKIWISTQHLLGAQRKLPKLNKRPYPGGGCLFEKFRVIKPTFTLLFYTVKWDNQKFDKKKPENEEFKQVKIKLERPEWILSR